MTHTELREHCFEQTVYFAKNKNRPKETHKSLVQSLTFSWQCILTQCQDVPHLVWCLKDTQLRHWPPGHTHTPEISCIYRRLNTTQIVWNLRWTQEIPSLAYYILSMQLNWNKHWPFDTNLLDILNYIDTTMVTIQNHIAWCQFHSADSIINSGN